MIIIPPRRMRRKTLPADAPKWVSFLFMCGYILACAAAGIAITVSIITVFQR